MPLPVMGIVFRDASLSIFSSVLATTLRIYPLEVYLVNIPVPVWVQYITGTGIQRCPYRYWHFAFWSSTNKGTVHYPVWAWYITGTGIKWYQYRCWHLCILDQYQYRHGTLTLLALNGARAILHFCLVPVWARYITGTGIKWCQYR